MPKPGANGSSFCRVAPRRARWPEIGARRAAQRPARERKRDPESVAGAAFAWRGDCEIRRAREDGREERSDRGCARAQVRIAKHVGRLGARELERSRAAGARRLTLAERAVKARDQRSRGTPKAWRRIPRPVVGEDDSRRRQGVRQGFERRRQPLSLVARRHHDDRHGTVRVSVSSYCPVRLSRQRRTRMAAIEAHISGVVWRVDCAIGDEISEGDTVVVLESMKMEMPVEADSGGTVREILCAVGDKVNEGDPLIVLG